MAIMLLFLEAFDGVLYCECLCHIMELMRMKIARKMALINLNFTLWVVP